MMEHLKALFGKIVCITNRLYAFDELVEPGPIKTVFADFELCAIREFGRRLPGKLIEKWHSLGREYSIDAKDYHYAVASSEHKIATVIGTGILPTYPIFLIGLLQVDTSPSSTVQNAGSYGHILESLITRSEEHTSELQSPDHLVCRLLLEKKKQNELKSVQKR